MWYTFKRLSLGLGAIALASIVLLMSDAATHRKPSVANGSTDHAPPRVARVRILEFVNLPDVEDAERGVLEGIRDAGVIAGRDFDFKVLNAQGDMATLNGMVDAAIADEADLIITLSTPTLQATLQRARSQSIVFTFLADPIAAGAAKSDTDHLPNVTGAYGAGDVNGMVKLIQAVMPQGKTVGTLYVPAEINSVYNHDLFVAAAKKVGLDPQPLGVSTPAEVPDAALVLCEKNPDLICLPTANMTAAAFPSIVQATDRAAIPVFAFLGGLAAQGAVASLARDYYDMGHDAGGLAARVIRGENPADIPLKPATTTRLYLNQGVAGRLKISFPDSLVKTAFKVID